MVALAWLILGFALGYATRIVVSNWAKKDPLPLYHGDMASGPERFDMPGQTTTFVSPVTVKDRFEAAETVDDMLIK